jgi:hypothetical protein
VWPELDVYWRPAERQRTFLELAGASDRDGPKREAAIGLYQDYLNLPSGYLRAGYRFSFSTSDASYRESRIVGEGVVTAYSSGMVRLVDRGRLELRWVNGTFSYRVRERLRGGSRWRHMERSRSTTIRNSERSRAWRGESAQKRGWVAPFRSTCTSRVRTTCTPRRDT